MNKQVYEALQKNAQARLDKATTPEEVKAATEDLTNLDSMKKEIEDTEKSNATLLASYKEIVKGQPLDKKPSSDDEDDEPKEGLSFEEALEKVLAKRKEK